MKDRTVAWVEQRIAEHRPPQEIGHGQVGRALQHLAEACAALEGRPGNLFGLTATDTSAVTADRERLFELALGALVDWQERLHGQLGAEGDQAFETVTRRHGFRFHQPVRGLDLSPGDAALLDRFFHALGQTERLTERWLELGYIDPLDEDVIEGEDEDDFEKYAVEVSLGPPDRAALEDTASEYEETVARPFPPLLHALWSRADGVAVEKTLEPAGPPVVTDALGEPELWPARRATFFDTDERLFVFGDIADSGHVALRFRGEEEHPDVVWLSDGESTPIAPSLGAYLEAWADAAFCIRGVLRRVGVRGWCG
jgi:hypothetical protein